MPTVLSHPAVPLAIALAAGPALLPRRLVVAGVLASVIPDLDSFGFLVGVPYAHMFGHRGVSHSLAFAFILAILGAFSASALQSRRLTAFLFLFVSTASHGLLDTLTDAGLGVALLSPFTADRFFAPWRPIPAAAINPVAFASGNGLGVLVAELLLLWVPVFTLALAVFAVRRWRAA